MREEARQCHIFCANRVPGPCGDSMLQKHRVEQEIDTDAQHESDASAHSLRSSQQGQPTSFMSHAGTTEATERHQVASRGLQGIHTSMIIRALPASGLAHGTRPAPRPPSLGGPTRHWDSG